MRISSAQGFVPFLIDEEINQSKLQETEVSDSESEEGLYDLDVELKQDGPDFTNLIRTQGNCSHNCATVQGQSCKCPQTTRETGCSGYTINRCT